MRGLVIAAVVAFVLATAHADVPLAGLELADQHGDKHRIGPDVRTILFTGDMEASTVVHTLLGKKNANWLPANHAVFIADVHRMPSLITRFVAKPRMRGYPYRILLIEDEATGAAFPQKKGEVAVLRVADGRVVGERWVTSPEALEAAITRGAS